MKDNVPDVRQEITADVKIEMMIDGKVTKTVEKKNAICASTQEWGRRMYRAMFSWYNHHNPTSNGNADYRAWMRYVHLLNVPYVDETDPRIDGTKPIYPDDTLPDNTGYLDRENYSNNDDTKLGLINREESYSTEDKTVFVYDWQASKGIGIFNTILHGADSNPADTALDTIHWEMVPVGGKPFFLNTENGNYTHGFAIEGNYLYMAKEGTSGERRQGIRRISITTGYEDEIVFPVEIVLDVDPVYVRVKTVGTKIYYYLADSYSEWWNVVIYDSSDSSWVCHNDTIDGTAMHGSISFFGDSVYLYRTHYPAPHQYGTKKFSLDLQTLQGGMQQTRGPIYSDGKFWRNDHSYRSELTEGIDIPWDNSVMPMEKHKYGDDGMDYECIDGDEWYSRKSVGWRHNYNNSTNAYTLVKRTQTAGVFPYRGREGAILRLDPAISKSDLESMRITYTFNFL